MNPFPFPIPFRNISWNFILVGVAPGHCLIEYMMETLTVMTYWHVSAQSHFQSCVQSYSGTYSCLKSRGMPMKGMGFILSGPFFLFVGFMMKFPVCVAWFLCNSSNEDPDSKSRTNSGGHSMKTQTIQNERLPYLQDVLRFTPKSTPNLLYSYQLDSRLENSDSNSTHPKTKKELYSVYVVTLESRVFF